MGEPGEPRPVVVVARVIHTLDPQRPVARALAMRGGELLAVGSREEALAAAGEGAVVDEFPDGVIVPGLVDAHGHLAALGESLATVGVSEAKSEGEAVAWLKAHEGEPGASDWLVGTGWDQNRWEPPALPTAASLDAAFPRRPVVVHRVDGHALWVNGEAMRRSGLTAAVGDPPGGRILRGAGGARTGVLIDNAMDLVARHVPLPTPEERRRRLARALERLVRVGLTGVHDAGLDLETLRTLQEWDLSGRLPMRVYAMGQGQGGEAEELLAMGPFKGRWLELKAVKFLLDGALGSRGAALFQPYADEPGRSGLLLLEPADFEVRARRFAEAGFQVAVHAIGDRASHLALDVLGRLEAARPGSRHRVEHAQLLEAEDVARFPAFGVVASFQPTHATSDMPWAEARVGRERLAYAYAWRSVLDAGGRLALGSDFPVEDPNPLWGLYAARTRQDRWGNPPGGWFPAQRLTPEEALAGFTTGAAWASFSEGLRGRLIAGADADFVVLSVDPLGADPRELLRGEVLLTVVGGVDVYHPPGSPPPPSPR